MDEHSGWRNKLFDFISVFEHFMEEKVSAVRCSPSKFLVVPKFHLSSQNFGYSFAFVGKLYLCLPVLPLSERSLNSNTIPRHTHLSLKFLFSMVLDSSPWTLKLVAP